jgi:hypothetical protein
LYVFIGSTNNFLEDSLAREDDTKVCINEFELEDVSWIHLAQDKDQWRAPLNTVKYL